MNSTADKQTIFAESTSHEAPLTRARIAGFDLARCLAILCMVYVNFWVVLAYSTRTPSWLRTFATMLEGNAAATFVMLAGVGVVLLSKRTVILKRALFFLVAGYLFQLLWPGDILHYYGFYMLMGVTLLQCKGGWLSLGVAVAIGGWLLAFEWFDYGEGWRWMTLSYPEFWTWKGQVRNLLFNGWHPLFPWLAFFFCGMAITRWGIDRPRNRRLAMIIATVVYVVVFFASDYLTQRPDDRAWWSQISQWYHAPSSYWGMDSIPPGPFYVLSAGAVSVFWIAICLELTAIKIVSRLFLPFIRCGQIALTCYIAHVPILYFVVTPLVEDSTTGRLVITAWSALAFGVGAILFAWGWRAFFARGPLEWVVRRICG